MQRLRLSGYLAWMEGHHRPGEGVAGVPPCRRRDSPQQNPSAFEHEPSLPVGRHDEFSPCFHDIEFADLTISAELALHAAPQRAGDLTRASWEGQDASYSRSPSPSPSLVTYPVCGGARAACVPSQPPIGATPISIAVACRAMAFGSLGWLARYLGRMFRATRQKQESRVIEFFFFCSGNVSMTN